MKILERGIVRERHPERGAPEGQGDQAVADRPLHRRRVHLLPQLQVDPQHLRAPAVRSRH